jgi:hypothetical protein
MKPLIYISDGKTYDLSDNQFHMFVCFSDKVEDELLEEGHHYSLKEFEKYIDSARPCSIRIKFETQEEFEYLIDQIQSFVTSLDVIAKHNRPFDLTPLETCSELESVQFYWNTKQEKLWDVQKNSKLKFFQMMDYYKVADFSAFRGSSIEDLRLFGCNGCGSFVSKMHITDLSFILDMPNLQKLSLDIIKDESSAYYLELFAKCHKLTELNVPDNFFTFQQFAWLKSNMPNVKNGLECVFRGNDFFSIIGKRTPKNLQDEAKALKYQIKYDVLIEKYKTRSIPPTDDEKD